MLTTILYTLIGTLALAWLLAAVWVGLGSLLEALAEWTTSAAAWFHRHGV